MRLPERKPYALIQFIGMYLKHTPFERAIKKQ